MKKKLAAVTALALSLVLSACSLPAGKTWKDSDFQFQKGEETVALSKDSGFMIFGDESYSFSFDGNNNQDYEESFVLARGLKVGDSLDEYLNEFQVKPANAMWELVYDSGDTRVINYDNETAEEIYKAYEDANAWLDIAFYKDGSRWKNMAAADLADVWFCDKDSSYKDDVVILSVNTDDSGKIQCISVYYFTYGSKWIEWQGWKE